jgi:hypothetical protein
MARVRGATASLAVVLLSNVTLLADSIPNWTAPRSWTPPRSAVLEKIRKSPGVATLGIEALPTGPLPFFGITPCRIVDTRGAVGPHGGPALAANVTRTFNLPSGPCAGVPSAAGAYSLNLTIIGTSALQGGFLTAWPTGDIQPTVSTLNFNGSEVVANAAVVPAGTSGSINVFVNIPGHLLIDINGYYAGSSLASPKTVAVDCTAGQSIQATIDREDGPLVVDVDGICNENVSIKRKDVTLRGTNPLNDGIQGVVAVPQFAVLRFAYVDVGRVENLSIVNGPSLGIVAFFSHLTMTNSRITGNAGAGMAVAEGSVVDATGLTVSQNMARGANVQRGAIFFCHECNFENNVGFAASASSGGVLSLLNTVVTGPQGLSSANWSYADIDCITEKSSHPCSLQVAGRAAQAFGRGTVALYGAGNFTGQVGASDHGTVQLIGARQTATAQPGQGPIANGIDAFATLFAATDDVTESQLFGLTNVTGFGRLLLRNATTLAGTIQCGSAGDAWLDPTVIANPGSAVTGCEHGALPP